jgi:hypothetical protein
LEEGRGTGLEEAEEETEARGWRAASRAEALLYARPPMAVKARVSPTALLAAATWACLLSLVAASAFDVPTVAFEERFSPLFGDGNLVRSPDDRSVRLLLDRRSGTWLLAEFPT